MMNESGYIWDKNKRNCGKHTKILIKQFQICKNVAKKVFIEYP